MSLLEYLQSTTSTLKQAVSARSSGSNIGIVSVKWGHHAAKSGIWQAAADLGGATALPYPVRLMPRAVMEIFRSDLDDDSVDAAQIIAYCRLTGIRNLLFLNGDLSLRVINELKKSSAIDKLIGVFHQPTDFLSELVELADGRIFDGGICVATCQIDLVKSIVVEGGPTEFIPHGVEIDYFVPPPAGAPERRKLVLCVGNHRRDYITLSKTADLIVAELPDYEVIFVGKKPEGSEPWENVHVRTGISDAELLQLYQQAHVVLLPLETATANNTVLESLACETPVVVTDIAGIRDYIGPDCAVLCEPGNAQAHADGVFSLIRDKERWAAAAKAARRRVEPLDWKHVQVLYRDLVERVVAAP